MSDLRRCPTATIADLLTGLHREPGRPRFTWYGPDGERIDLSGAVLDNWVSKTVNLLVQEFDTGPGSTVRIDLPPHWRTAIWALAAWRCGASLTCAGIPDVLVTDHPNAAADGTEVVAVALPALARRWPEPPLAPGVIDAAQAVMTYGDTIGWAPQPDNTLPALPGVLHGDLLTAAESATGPMPHGSRVLLQVDEAEIATFLLLVTGVLVRDSSIVLISGDHNSQQIERILSAEKITQQITATQ